MDKKQRGMLAKAERFAKKDQEEHKLRKRFEDKGQEFCSGCLAVKEDGACPSCGLMKSHFEKFCRHCLHVHANTVKNCKAWTPPER